METTVKERPILFKGEMVRAIIAGRKTHTRREITKLLGFPKIRQFGRSDTPGYDWHFRCKRGLWQDMRHQEVLDRCPYGKIGDRLYVRETWAPCSTFDPSEETGAIHKAGPWRNGEEPAIKWRPAIHMPRWASRIALEIVNVRIERLNDISEEDAIAEGTDFGTDAFGNRFIPPLDATGLSNLTPCRDTFQKLWKSINGPDSWTENPFVWVVEFKTL